MRKVISREDARELQGFNDILDAEGHHDHVIEMIDDFPDTLMWKANPEVQEIVDLVGLNAIVAALHEKGYDKNSELYRKIYRDIGYTLSGYWEIFYWDANNENYKEYKGSK